MPYFILDYSCPYPKRLKELNGPDSKRALYNQLKTFSLDELSSVTNFIRTSICKVYPELKQELNQYPLYGSLEEMIKNIFDSVNIQKIELPTLDAIQIRIVISESNNKITIKIKDNGIGFAHLKKSTQKPLSDYLSGKHCPFLPNFFGRFSRGRDEKSSKRYHKIMGKDFILGGLNVGLKDMNKGILKLNGEVYIKNRKHGGASISITLPFENSKKDSISFPKECKACQSTLREKDILWDKIDRTPKAVHCLECNHSSFINPFQPTF